MSKAVPKYKGSFTHAGHNWGEGGACSLTAKRRGGRCLAGGAPHSHGRGAHGAVGGAPGHAERFPWGPTQDGSRVATLQPRLGGREGTLPDWSLLRGRGGRAGGVQASRGPP